MGVGGEGRHEEVEVEDGQTDLLTFFFFFLLSFLRLIDGHRSACFFYSFLHAISEVPVIYE